MAAPAYMTASPSAAMMSITFTYFLKCRRNALRLASASGSFDGALFSSRAGRSGFLSGGEGLFSGGFGAGLFDSAGAFSGALFPAGGSGRVSSGRFCGGAAGASPCVSSASSAPAEATISFTLFQNSSSRVKSFSLSMPALTFL